MALATASTFNPGKDLCLGFFADVWPHCPPIREGGRVLEIGCAEADWLGPMHAARPDLELWGLDWRPHPRKAAHVQIRGDIFRQIFPRGSFDAIIMVSVIHWVGIGHYGDPKRPEADRELMLKCRDWLTSTGWLYFDTAYEGPSRTNFQTVQRRYDDGALERLYQGRWTEHGRWHFGDRTRIHDDGPFVAIVVKPI